jgi:hypothetical protein
MKWITQHFRLSYILLLALVVGACSSGGGGGSAPPPADTTVGGSVVKGTIKNALVEIFAIESGSVAAQPLETTTTDANGDYSFTLDPNFSGSVMIQVSDNNDPGTPSTMTCDVVSGCGTFNFGDDMPLGSIVLKTVVANVTGGSEQTAAVTPYTLMAAEYAMTLGGLSSDNIAAANSQVGNLLGVNNIVLTDPPDITTQTPDESSFNESKYAYLVAAVASLAQQSFGGDIAAAVSALASSYADNGGQLTSAELVNDDTVISLADLASHANMQAVMNNADGQVQNALDSLLFIAQATPGLTTTEPSPTTGLGEVETVKAFVADVRTWGNVIDQEINNSTNTFGDEADMAGVTFDAAGPLLADAFEHAITAAFEAYITGATIDLSTFTFPVIDPLNPTPTATGTATVTDDGTNTTVVLSGTIDDVTTNFTIVAPSLDNGGNLIGTTFDVSISGLTIQNASAAITAESGSVGIVYPASVDLTAWVNDTITEPFPDPDSGSLELTNVAITEVDSMDPVSFSGSLSATIVGSKGDTDAVVRDINGFVVQYNPASVSLSGELSNSANSFTAHMSATMDNADTFMPLPGPQVGDVSTGIGSYAFSNAGNTLTITTPDLVRTIEFNEQTQIVTVTEVYGQYAPPPSTISNYVSMNDYLNSGSYYIYYPIYTWVDNEGYYEVPLPLVWDPSGDSLDGTLFSADSAPDEDANNFRILSDINITFTAQLDGLPQAMFSVIGNRTGFEEGDAMLTIAYGGRQIVVTANIANNDATGSIVITNQDGVVITYDRSDVTNNGIITYNGTKYADIEEVNGVTIIRYIDGYFDSL